MTDPRPWLATIGGARAASANGTAFQRFFHDAGWLVAWSINHVAGSELLGVAHSAPAAARAQTGSQDRDRIALPDGWAGHPRRVRESRLDRHGGRLPRM